MRKKLHHFFWQYHYRHSHRLQQMIHTMYGTSRKQNLDGATMPVQTLWAWLSLPSILTVQRHQ